MPEASPSKSALEALAVLRKTFRAVSRSYAERLEADLTLIQDRLARATEVASSNHPALAKAKRAAGLGPDPQLADLRDMLTLMRTLEVKPPAGRRKDLKKIETVIDDLRQLSDRWD